ncbi:hypothetical protein Q4555_06720 [Octadecabacter sp. 1_MG-2023]|uniref:hypothetical protein n=1 Tax=unclassified Octadecabacter TaxID=196158 RepID=UPI001C0A2C4E|nr:MULTISPECIES: hypothetical protein [unclassified Octadecabacter]MBU2994357.1 hypothetical protein [Octadecabacter sp. B2R22]MDO6734354.1 hypothetical protein [Octadecabacter sp. 1_MG-2023]
MSGLIKLAVVGAAIVGIGFWIAEGVERQNVRDCLAEQSQRYGIARGHDVYLSDVVEVEVYQTYGDNTATRFVKYRIQGSHELQSTTCRW